jgi:hypothetical protein
LIQSGTHHGEESGMWLTGMTPLLGWRPIQMSLEGVSMRLLVRPFSSQLRHTCRTQGHAHSGVLTEFPLMFDPFSRKWLYAEQKPSEWPLDSTLATSCVHIVLQKTKSGPESL